LSCAPRLASTSRFYAYPKKSGYAIAVNPPNFPLPDDAEYAARERADVMRWIETIGRKIA